MKKDQKRCTFSVINCKSRPLGNLKPCYFWWLWSATALERASASGGGCGYSLDDQFIHQCDPGSVLGLYQVLSYKTLFMGYITWFFHPLPSLHTKKAASTWGRVFSWPLDILVPLSWLNHSLRSENAGTLTFSLHQLWLLPILGWTCDYVDVAIKWYHKWASI